MNGVLIAVLAAVAGAADVELFTREGCPRCEEARVVLETLQAERPALVIDVLDVGADPAARERLRALASAAGVAAPGVPAFHVRGQLIVGVLDRETTAARLAAALDGAPAAAAEPGEVCAAEEPICNPPSDEIHLPLFGRVSATELGLPVFTVVVALVDGFNPCAMWVLLFLLSLLVNLKSRARMTAVAGTFVLASGVVYFAFMAAWLSFFFVIGVSRTVALVLGLLAVVVGIVHVKDFFAFGRGPSLSIPSSAKPRIYARVRRIVNAENLAGAVVAAAGLAFLVNLVELLCTAGLPAVYTSVLAARELPRPSYYGYLGLYNAVYMLDDALVLAVCVVTLGKHKLQERGGRLLKLLSGVVMLALGVVMLVAPGWLGW
jgi:hypothetical protein